LCLGFVGSEGRRFCLKLIKRDGTTCGVLKHRYKFEAKPGHFYLRSNDTTAFCEPCFPEYLVPIELQADFKTMSKTIEEWKQLFTNYLHDAEGQEGQALEIQDFCSLIWTNSP
jgi:hypothetical protein